jgi:hypothetical protein
MPFYSFGLQEGALISGYSSRHCAGMTEARIIALVLAFRMVRHSPELIRKRYGISVKSKDGTEHCRVELDDVFRRHLAQLAFGGSIR